ncbi:MAG TPA: CoA-binding protein [Acidobacteriaceae bacterium]|nr:CoA-binding protein [Acidobacteriaceae bacterium]
MNEQHLIDEILAKTKTIAVVGLSDKPDRASYGVSAQMQKRGYRIAPVNPSVDSVLGEKCYASLRDIPFRVDLVNVFRLPQFVPQIVEDTIAIGAPFLWLQEGIVHPEATATAEAHGIRVVADRCIYKEHLRWSAEQHTNQRSMSPPG